MLRLVAGGAEARQRLTVAPVPPRVLSFSAPERVKIGAKRVTLRVRVTSPMTLTVAGRTSRLRTGANTVAVALPKRPATGVLWLPLKLGDTRSELLVTRT